MSSFFLDSLAGTHLYPLTDRYLSRQSHAQQVSVLSDSGLKVIQLREKLLSALDFYREAEEALRLARQRSVKIIINDRLDMALALKADGVHLGQDDVPPEAARKLLGPKAIIGFSTHNVTQAELSTTLPIDYIAIGPIFSTGTKGSVDPVVGLEGLSKVRRAVGRFPLVAIGGITSLNTQAVLDAGADAVAVISDIWISPGDMAVRIKVPSTKPNNHFTA